MVVLATCSFGRDRRLDVLLGGLVSVARRRIRRTAGYRDETRRSRLWALLEGFLINGVGNQKASKGGETREPRRMRSGTTRGTRSRGELVLVYRKSSVAGPRHLVLEVAPLVTAALLLSFSRSLQSLLMPAPFDASVLPLRESVSPACPSNLLARSPCAQLRAALLRPA